MQVKIIKLLIVSIIIFIIGVFFISLDKNTSYKKIKHYAELAMELKCG